MDKELKKQRIKSLIEQAGYAEMEMPRASGRWWKWLVAVTALVTLGQIVIDVL